MEESIIQAFSDCLSSDCEIRKNAENLLASVHSSPGFIPILLKICQDNFQSDIKQLSALQLKKLLDSRIVLPDEDVNYLKINIIQFLKFSTDEKLRESFEQIVKLITNFNFPCEKIMNQIDNALESEDYDIVFSGINMICHINFTGVWNDQEQLQIFSKFISRQFSVLNEILNCLLCEGITGNDNFVSDTFRSVGTTTILTPSQYFSWKCVQLILETYKKSFHYWWNASCTINMERWWSKFQKILEFECESFQVSEYQNIEALSPIWESKTLVANIFSSTLDLFNNYYSQFNNENKRKSIEIFTGKWEEPLLKFILQAVFERNTHFLPDTVTASYISYVSSVIQLKPETEFLKSNFANSSQPVIIAFINECILPLFCLKQEDEKTWNENPLKFIQENNYSNQSSLLTNTAKHFLYQFTSIWGFEQFADFFMKEINTINIIKKEALLAVLGVVAYSARRKNAKIKTITSSIISNFESQNRFLRWRMCQVFGILARYDWLNANKKQRKLIYCKLLALMEDPELPVKYEAARTISVLLTKIMVKELAHSEIDYLLNIYVSMIKETHSCEITNNLNSIVWNCPEYLIQHGLEVVQKLITICIEKFQAIDSKINESESFQVENSSFRCGIYNIIYHIIRSFRENLDYLAKASLFMMPIFDFEFSNKFIRSGDEALSILQKILEYSPQETQNSLCKYAEMLINQCLDCNVNLYNIKDSIKFFIEIYSETIGIQIFFNFIKNYLEKERDERSRKEALQILLESRKGLFDRFLPEIIELIKLKTTGINYWELLCLALWNNSKIVSMELKQQNILDSLIEFINLNIHYIWYGYFICGICSLFLVIDEILPNNSVHISSLLKMILSWWTRLHGWDNSFNDENEDKRISESYEENYEYNLNYPFCSMLFREIDFKKFIWSSIANFREKNSDLYREIKRNLNEQEILTLKSIISD